MNKKIKIMIFLSLATLAGLGIALWKSETNNEKIAYNKIIQPTPKMPVKHFVYEKVLGSYDCKVFKFENTDNSGYGYDFQGCNETMIHDFYLSNDPAMLGIHEVGINGLTKELSDCTKSNCNFTLTETCWKGDTSCLNHEQNYSQTNQLLAMTYCRTYYMSINVEQVSDQEFNNCVMKTLEGTK